MKLTCFECGDEIAGVPVAGDERAEEVPAEVRDGAGDVDVAARFDIDIGSGIEQHADEIAVSAILRGMHQRADAKAVVVGIGRGRC